MPKRKRKGKVAEPSPLPSTSKLLDASMMLNLPMAGLDGKFTYLDENATLPDLPLYDAGISLVPISNEASREHVLTIPISSCEIS
ncbi:hypothetical protein POTOM_034070 [Populus tomentosa]|uniref:Uncharacterized protein n=1 Tax=Populus tomentosa TaxID=118781 RepID=A0A8X7YWF6_POPTO|nr:hypothetical protein POTOM_034070 [Populus tomentosa]